MNLDVLLRTAAFLLLTILAAYWFSTKKRAEEIKPKTSGKTISGEKIAIGFGSAIIYASILGFNPFPFKNSFIQLFGFVLILIGFLQAMIARKTLSSNWAESYAYQIKKNHELVTKGIYRHVRHPIYGGFYLMATGALMVSESYFYIPVAALLPFIMAAMGRREEKILLRHFGDRYSIYIKSTKMLIPFLF